MKQLACILLFCTLLTVGCGTLGATAGDATYRAAHATMQNPPPGAIDPETGLPVEGTPPNTPLGWVQWATGIVTVLASGYVAQKTVTTVKKKKEAEREFLGKLEPKVFNEINGKT